MIYRQMLGFVAGFSALCAVLFSVRIASELLENVGKSNLVEFSSWLVGSVLVCAVSVLVMLIDYALERVAREQN
jgi:uncharacterized membrane protein YdcZ (DUF606 family)